MPNFIQNIRKIYEQVQVRSDDRVVGNQDDNTVLPTTIQQPREFLSMSDSDLIQTTPLGLNTSGSIANVTNQPTHVSEERHCDKIEGLGITSMATGAGFCLGAVISASTPISLPLFGVGGIFCVVGRVLSQAPASENPNSNFSSAGSPPSYKEVTKKAHGREMTESVVPGRAVRKESLPPSYERFVENNNNNNMTL